MDVRSEKINHAIRRGMSEILLHEMDDPSLPQFISVNDVKISRDLSFANIFVSATTDGVDQSARCVEKLNRYAGKLRARLADTTPLRRIPRIRFRVHIDYDQLDRINQLIDDNQPSE